MCITQEAHVSMWGEICKVEQLSSMLFSEAFFFKESLCICKNKINCCESSSQLPLKVIVEDHRILCSLSKCVALALERGSPSVLAHNSGNLSSRAKLQGAQGNYLM